MTGEIYYTNPWVDEVYRMNLHDSDIQTQLLYQPRDHKRILTLDDIRIFPQWLQHATERHVYRDSIGTTNGSIGTNMARLWKGEVDAVLLKSWTSQPWDRVPCAGISDAMWYTTIQITADNYIQEVPMDKSWSLEAMTVPYQLIVHEKERIAVCDILQKQGFILQ
jgi:hypothetical protein